MRKVAPAGIMADEGGRELIDSAGEKSLEEVICSECWRSGPVRSSGTDDGVNIDVPSKPAGNSQAFEIRERVAKFARLYTFRYIQVTSDVDKLQYLLIQYSILIHVVIQSNIVVNVSIR